jgi:DnaJ family protein C protein 3
MQLTVHYTILTLLYPARQFHEIAEAHEVLTNDEMRAKYDRGEDPLAQDGGGGGGHHHNPFGGGQHFTFHFG